MIKVTSPSRFLFWGSTLTFVLLAQIAIAQQNNPLRGRYSPAHRNLRSSQPQVRVAAPKPNVQRVGYVPKHQQNSVIQAQAHEEVTVGTSVVSGEPILDGAPVPAELPPLSAPIYDSAHGVYGGGCNSCGDSCGGGCGDCCNDCGYGWSPLPGICLDNVELFAGVQGFTGPNNRGSTGSFGFNEGVNWAAPLDLGHGQFGIQAGYRAVQANFSGADFTDDDRTQSFVTLGIFRRVDCGLQGGLAVDYLTDNWYYDVDLVQIRGEISMMFSSAHEIGFWFNSGTDTTTSVSVANGQSVTETFEATDVYAFFYRPKFSCYGAHGRLFGGFTGNSDGIIGADLRLPLSQRMALETGFAYLIPEQNNTNATEESWNVGVNLVWYPFCRTATGRDYYRPLLGVANNGSFFVDRR